MHAHFGYAVAK